MFKYLKCLNIQIVCMAQNDQTVPSTYPLTLLLLVLQYYNHIKKTKIIIHRKYMNSSKV